MTSQVYGARIAQARALRRLTAKAVAAAAGMRPDQLSRLERGDGPAQISDAMSAALVAVLRCKPQFLQAPPVSHVQEESLLFRAPKRMTKAEKKFLAAYMEAIDEVARAATAVMPFPPRKIPTVWDGQPPAQVAREARTAMGLDADKPIGSVTRALERSGVLVVARSRDLTDPDSAGTDDGSATERHIGVSAWLGEFKNFPVILVQVMDSWERTRWTLAHELGHLCLHTAGMGAAGEEEASQFATEFLAPIEQVRMELPSPVTLTGLVAVKMHWGVSVGALIRHLARNKLIDQNRTHTLQRQLYSRINPDTGRTWGVTEPGWDAHAPERPRMLMKWLEETTGIRSPRGMAAAAGIVVPLDVVAGMLAHQLGGPHTQPAAARAGGGLAPVLAFPGAR